MRGGLSPSPSDLNTPVRPARVRARIRGSAHSEQARYSRVMGPWRPRRAISRLPFDPTDSGCRPTASAGAGPLGLTSTLGAAPAFSDGSVPLGATALSTTGLAGTIGASTPGGLSPCTGSSSPNTVGTGLAPPPPSPSRERLPPTVAETNFAIGPSYGPIACGLRAQ